MIDGRTAINVAISEMTGPKVGSKRGVCPRGMKTPAPDRWGGAPPITLSGAVGQIPYSEKVFSYQSFKGRADRSAKLDRYL